MDVFEFKKGNDETIEVKSDPVAEDTYFLVDTEGKVWRVEHSTLVAAVSGFNNLIEVFENVENAPKSSESYFKWGDLKIQGKGLLSNDPVDGITVQDEGGVAQLTFLSVTSQKLTLRLAGNVAEIKGNIAAGGLTIKDFQDFKVEADFVCEGIGLTQRDTPDDPSAGNSFIWQDINGDIKIKINSGGTIKTTTLVDFSTI